MGIVLSFLISNWRVILVAGLIALCGVFFKLWREDVRSFKAYKVTQQAAYEVALAEKKQVESHQEEVLTNVSNAWNAQIKPLQQAAVARYIAHYGSTGIECNHPVGVQQQSVQTLPGPAANTQGSSSTEQERVVACTGDFISACAEDALARKLTAQWAEQNKIKPAD